MRAFKIHPQIEADSAYVMDLELCQVRLHNNAAFPWLMLIPDTDVIELVDLTEYQRQSLMQEICLASTALRQLYSPLKLNVASIGNAVSQIHVHVIARYEDDGAWPRPVWYAGVEKVYSEQERAQRIDEIRTQFLKLQ